MDAVLCCLHIAAASRSAMRTGAGVFCAWARVVLERARVAYDWKTGKRTGKLDTLESKL